MNRILYWTIRIVPAIILLQTLFYKFTAAQESIALFSKLHAEPFGRIGAGIIELITAILLVNPKTSFYGAILGFFTMLGAIASHIFIIGITINNDGGTLFILAILTFICCAIILFDERNKFSIFQKS